MLRPSNFSIVPSYPQHPRPFRTLLLDPVHVHHVTAHGIFSREDGLTDRANRVAPVYTAMMGKGIATIVGSAADVAHPTTAFHHVVQLRSAPDPVENEAHLLRWHR